MRKIDRLFAQRLALFVFGLTILLVAIFLLLPDICPTKPALYFTGINVVILYELWIGPLLAGDRINEFTGGRIVSIGMVFRATIPYTIVTLILTFLANTVFAYSIKWLVVAQLVALFGFLLAVFGGKLASSQVEAVEQSEKATRLSVDGLRSLSEQLVSAMGFHGVSSGRDLGELSDLVNKIYEELRYMSPVQTSEAEMLEQQIGSGIRTLLAIVNADEMSPGQVDEACKVAQRTLVQISSRKRLHN